MILFNNDKKREIIMKHYLTPLHKGDISNMSLKIENYSSKCVDKLNLGINIKNNVITDAKYQAEGCAIFLSSVDIMIDQIINKKIKDVKKIIFEYENLINNKITKIDILNELNVFNNIATHSNRLHCAQLISDTLKKII